jgi:hypothetical protein
MAKGIPNADQNVLLKKTKTPIVVMTANAIKKIANARLLRLFKKNPTESKLEIRLSYIFVFGKLY